MKTSSRSTTTSAVGVLALATMMSMAALGNSTGASAVVLASAYPGSQLGARTAGDEELMNWITCLTQAAKSLRGGPRLPEHLGAAVALPSLAGIALHESTSSRTAYRTDRLPLAQPTLQSHLLDLPPPALV